MGKHPKHNEPAPPPVHKNNIAEYYMYKDNDDRKKALEALKRLKEREAELARTGKLVKLRLPHANGVVYTNAPEEFERKIKENDFFKV